MQSILTPVDGSRFSEAAVLVARGIAAMTHARLHLALVHETPYRHTQDDEPIYDPFLDQKHRASEGAYLAQLQRSRGNVASIATTYGVVDGQVASALAQEVRAAHADLVVMATHGRGELMRIWRGSVADRLLRQCGVPLLLLRPSGTEQAAQMPEKTPVFREILIPLDGTQLGEQILEPALELARPLGATVTLLKVVDPFVSAGYSLPLPAPGFEAEARERHRQAAHAYLDSVAERMRAEGLTVRTRVVVDEKPAAAILDAARRLKPDLIALATHGYSGLKRLLIGSVADTLLRTGEWPLLLLRPLVPHAPADHA